MLGWLFGSGSNDAENDNPGYEQERKESLSDLINQLASARRHCQPETVYRIQQKIDRIARNQY